VNFRKGNALDQFAGVIFTRADSRFYTIEDMREARVEAVSISGLGAMQLQFAELLSRGLNIMTDVERLTFAYNQNRIVQDVESGYADVGFVRTDMIDRSVAANRTQWENFRVINEIEDDEFPFRRSTDFTPEWPIGALAHVPSEVSEFVAVALFELDRFSDDPELASPGQDGNFATWVPPKNYLSLLGMLERIGYYNPSSRVCLRSGDVHAAITCPDGWVRQSQERAFCEDDCRDGYTCICNPCSRVRDPEVVLGASALNTSWSGTVNTTAVQEMSDISGDCRRMQRCVTATAGQRLRWALTDQIGSVNRALINLPQIMSVQIRFQVDGDLIDMIAENVTVDGLDTQQYVLDASTEALGREVVQVQINGEQAPMSPVIVEHVAPPQLRIECPPGHSVDTDGACVMCEPGSSSVFPTDAFAPTCEPCRAGTAQSLSGQATCDLCVAGTASRQAGAVTCDECATGRFADALGSNECEQCSPGTYAAITGQPSCDRCEFGTYVADVGQVSCLSCTEVWAGDTTTMKLMTVDGREQPSQFDGATSRTACQCNMGSHNISGQCLRCGEGLSCLGMDWVAVEPGYHSYVDRSIYSCQGNEKRCRGGQPGAMCAAGRIGAACGACEEGTMPQADGSCLECTGGSAVLGWLAFSVFPIVASIMLYNGVNRPLKCKATAADCAGLSASLLVTGVQTMGVFGLTAIPWSGMARDAIKGASLFALDLEMLSLECARPDAGTATSRYVASIMLFVVAVLPVPLLHFCSQLLPARYKWAAPKSINTSGFVLQMLFMPVANVALTPMMCYEHPNKLRSVMQYPEVICGESTHSGLVVGGIVLVLACLGFYCGMVLVAVKVPDLSQREGSTILVSARFMMTKYTPTRWYWSCIVIPRAFLFSFVSVVIPDDARAQMLLLLIILSVYAALVCAKWPWKAPLVNALDGWISIFLVVALAGASANIPATDSESMWNGMVFASLICIYVISAVPMLVALISVAMNGTEADIGSLFNAGPLPDIDSQSSTIHSVCVEVSQASSPKTLGDAFRLLPHQEVAFLTRVVSILQASTVTGNVARSSLKRVHFGNGKGVNTGGKTGAEKSQLTNEMIVTV